MYCFCFENIMIQNHLPTTLGQWKRYFDTTFQYIREIVPVIAFGQNKIDLIITNLNDFQTSFLQNHSQSISEKEGPILFDFFTTCAAFISFSYNYTSKKMLNYLIKNPINEQFNELSLLWSCWSNQASSLLCKGFSDFNQLSYAHYLDIMTMYYTFTPVVNQLPIPVSNALKNKLDDILLILGNLPQQPDKLTPGVLQQSQFQYVRDLGKGSFAVVKLVKMSPSNIDVAVKELKMTRLSDRNILSLKREINALIQLNHPNVLKYYGVTVIPPFCIATKYLPNGSLFHALHENSSIQLSPTARMKIAIGMARGLEYLEAMKFIHRDFKSQNVLLDENLNPVISDFGFSRQLGNLMTHEIGSLPWIAPELLTPGRTNYDASVDVYSYGMVLYELLTGNIPMKSYYPTQAAVLISERELRPELPNDNPVMSNIIRSCWQQDPTKRPKAGNIRKWLESGQITFIGTELTELMNWINQTKPEHEMFMKHALERADREMMEILEKLHTLRPLDPIAYVSLQQLYQMPYPLSSSLFEDVLRLMNQNQSVPVQDASFALMKQILMRKEIVSIVKPEKIVDEFLKMIDTQPLSAITAIKLIASQITDVHSMVNRLLSMPRTHLILDLLQVMISSNLTKVTPNDVIEIYNALSGGFAIGFFRFMMSVFGPLPEFIPLACQSLFLLSLYLKEMAALCETNVEKVKEIINLDEMNNETNESLQQILDSVSLLLVNQNIDVNEKMAIIIYKFIVNSCFTYNSTEMILPLLNMVARVESMSTVIAQTDIWNLIIGGLTSTGDELENSLLLVERLPICSDTTLRLLIWKTLVDKYIKTKDMKVTHAMCSLLKRKTDFDLLKLIPTLVLGLTSDDQNYCITSLKLARRFKPEVFYQLNTETFWRSLTNQMQKKDMTICKLIGKLVATMVDKMDGFTFDAQFFGSVISLIYDPNTTLDTALPFIRFLGTSCKARKIVVFLYKRSYIQYLEQLPWRYENDSRVADVIEYFASVMNRFYSASA